jgi:hypothetical protein
MNSRSRIFDVASSALARRDKHLNQPPIMLPEGAASFAPVRAAQDSYENFLPLASFPVIRTGVNGEAAGASFFLFLSAFGFFFSRLLLIWPFAILSSLLPEVAYSSFHLKAA